MIINSCAKRCIIYLHSNVPILQLHTKKMDAPIIKHASCGYSCCCSVGRLVVIPPISRRSRSGLSSHVSFRSLVLTWCVRGEGENGRWLWYDIYDLWLQIATTFENENDSCKKALPLRCYYRTTRRPATWLPFLNEVAVPSLGHTSAGD